MAPNSNNSQNPYNDPNLGATCGDAQNGATRVHGYGMGRGANQAPQPGSLPYGYQPQAGQPQAGGQPYAGQPSAANQPYAGQPHAGQPYAGQPYAGQPYTQQGSAAAYQQYAPQYAQYIAAQQMGYQAPTTSQTTNDNGKKRKRGPVFWIAIVVAILAVIAAVIIGMQMCNGGKNRAGDLGQLEGKTADEIQAELDRTVDEGMFNISIASIVQFQDGTSAGEIKIENVPGNRYLMQVVLTLDSDGQQVYESGIIEPNHHIQSDKLAVDLPAGTYPATATFTALDPETEEEIGQAAAKVTLVVLS
ncbi:hypothetical protein [Adlercreutzia sp. ZJ154]|uniref:hypothetical protein n=1 Tax=Adlercreutzia sp. ZJ154 TaxID=2709790 RepID=UPI0013EA3364|nr:hypothetical protein [Adlercreutzia sp. ZJ154]